jgi:hypothetical protein
MKEINICPLCGYSYIGHCICEYMSKAERIVWKETGLTPKHLRGYSVEELEAEDEEIRWWYE